MFANKLFLPLSVFVVFANFATAENTIEYFIRDRLDEYPGWVQSKSLDPSPLLPGPTYIRVSNGLWSRLDCYLSEHGVKDYSQSINVTSVQADLDRILVSFAIQQNVTFSGKYSANGTAGWESEELEGEGNWHITLPKIVMKNLRLNYTVSPTGHVQITGHNLDGVDIPSYYYDEEDAQIYFENLWEEGIGAENKEDIQKGLYSGFRTYLMQDPDHPLKTTYLQFFEEIFATRTWAEIVLPHLPPCTL